MERILIGEDDRHLVYIGVKNPTCQPCSYEGSIYPCPSSVCAKYSNENKGLLSELSKDNKDLGVYLRKKK